MRNISGKSCKEN